MLFPSVIFQWENYPEMVDVPLPRLITGRYCEYKHQCFHMFPISFTYQQWINIIP